MGTRLGTDLADTQYARIGTRVDAPPVWGIGDYDASTRLGTAVNQGLLGAVAGHWMRMIWWPSSVTGANAVRGVAANQPVGTGWRVRNSGTNTSHEYRIIVTGALEVPSPVLTITAAMVGRLLDSLWVWDPVSGALIFYVQGIEIGRTASVLTYLPPAGERTIVGTTNSGSSPATDCVIAGIEGGDGFIPTPAEVLAAHKASRARVAAGQLPLSGIANKTTWRAPVTKTWNPPVVVRDQIGTSDLTIVTGAASNLLLFSTRGIWV